MLIRKSVSAEVELADGEIQDLALDMPPLERLRLTGVLVSTLATCDLREIRGLIAGSDMDEVAERVEAFAARLNESKVDP